MKKRSLNYPVRKTIRFTPNEVGKLENLLTRSAYCPTISELVRNMLFKRKLTLNYRNESLERIRMELGQVRSELNKIGVNINQITHYFHLQADPKEREFFARELLPHMGRVEGKMEQIHGMIEALQILK